MVAENMSGEVCMVCMGRADQTCSLALLWLLLRGGFGLKSAASVEVSGRVYANKSTFTDLTVNTSWCN